MVTTQLPIPQSPICDPKNGLISTEWYLFLNSFVQSTTAAQGTTTASDVQLLFEQQRSDAPGIENMVNRMAVLEMLLQEQSVLPILERMQQRINELESLLLAQ